MWPAGADRLRVPGALSPECCRASLFNRYRPELLHADRQQRWAVADRIRRRRCNRAGARLRSAADRCASRSVSDPYRQRRLRGARHGACGWYPDPARRTRQHGRRVGAVARRHFHRALADRLHGRVGLCLHDSLSGGLVRHGRGRARKGNAEHRYGRPISRSHAGGSHARGAPAFDEAGGGYGGAAGFCRLDEGTARDDPSASVQFRYAGDSCLYLRLDGNGRPGSDRCADHRARGPRSRGAPVRTSRLPQRVANQAARGAVPNI